MGNKTVKLTWSYFFLGSINNQQASVGEISGFQLFSRYLAIEEVKITGCGYKADLFDSFYREFDVFGGGSTYVLEDVAVPFCSDESGKTFTSKSVSLKIHTANCETPNGIM